VGVVADANLVNVAAEDGVHPDAGVFADDDVADELGGVVDVAGVGELGSDAFVGADHGLSGMSREQETYHGAIAQVRWRMAAPRRLPDGHQLTAAGRYKTEHFAGACVTFWRDALWYT